MNICLGMAWELLASLCHLTLDLKPAPQRMERMGQQHYQWEILFIPKQEKHPPGLQRTVILCTPWVGRQEERLLTQSERVASFKLAYSKWTESGGVIMSWRDNRLGWCGEGIIKETSVIASKKPRWTLPKSRCVLRGMPKGRSCRAQRRRMSGNAGGDAQRDAGWEPKAWWAGTRSSRTGQHGWGRIRSVCDLNMFSIVPCGVPVKPPLDML